MSLKEMWSWVSSPFALQEQAGIQEEKAERKGEESEKEEKKEGEKEEGERVD